MRWGTRSLALLMTGVGLYVVAPSVLELLGAWPELDVVRPRWFVVLGVLELASFASLWWLTRMALAAPRHRRVGSPTSRATTSDVTREGTTGATTATHASISRSDGGRVHSPRWFDVASAQLAGVAASRVLPGGAASGGVVQARLLIQSGWTAPAVARALTAVGLLSTGVLLSLPILTVPALVIGPPPARQLQLGLVVSLVLAVVIVGLGVAMLTWTPFVTFVGRMAGRVLGRIRRTVTADRAAEVLVAQRDRVAEVFDLRWMRALGAAAANRVLDYGALVSALHAVGVEARPSEVLLAYVVSMALAMIPITPGGLGFVETGLTALLVLVGASADQAVLATLLYRLVSFWLPIPVGVLAWAGWSIRRRAQPAIGQPPGSVDRGDRASTNTDDRPPHRS
jgi:uncharacterized protein (TIRG00374 family)